MPRYRKYRKRKKYAKSAKALAKKALKKVNKIASGIEVKHHDLDITGPINIDWNPQQASLNLVPQGLTDTQRIGDKIKMLGMRFKIHLDLNGLSSALFRCIIMYDKENSINSELDFLEVTGVPNSLESPYDVDTRARYTILHDKVYTMSNGSNRKIQINLSKKINKFTQYLAGTTTIEKGRIRFWLYSDTSDLLVTKPQWYGYSRVYYQDS